MKFSVYKLSHRGGRRKNEDRMGYCYTRSACLLVLADGLGGHAAGEVAAQIALRAFSRLFLSQATPLLLDPQAFLVDALGQAHRAILRHASDQRMPQTPRTTVVAAVVQQGCASWIHCGDSRLYLVRDGVLLARTSDHSHQAMAERSGAPEEDVPRNWLLSCLGSPYRPMHDLAPPHALARGDRLLLCSDGLWDPLCEAELLATLAQGPVSLCVPRLVRTALQRAGPSSDNVTALALEWDMPAVPMPTAACTLPRRGDGVSLPAAPSVP